MLSIGRLPLARAWVASRHRMMLGSPRTTSSFFFSTSLKAKRWQVGDSVLLVDKKDLLSDEDKLVQGTVVEERGSGWYEIVLEGARRGDKIKCRGTQLKPYTNAPSSSSPVDVLSPVSASILTAKPLGTTAAAGGMVPPPPTIFDLDEALQQQQQDPVQNPKDQTYLEQVAHHRSFQKWVVFTDLHCSPATLDTTLQVLDRVHQLAQERQAGVLFLGDWWHHRGSLRVDCLNAVLNQLKHWTVPMILIPGNHDQVTLGGHNHGLTPLENAYRISNTTHSFPGPLVFSYPTKFANALFVPHIRYHAILESVLQSPAAHEAQALFVHADVTGAYMNDLVVSFGGVPPSRFPANKPIYSGHFHKPHVVQVKQRSIEYLGSPYQVSLAEAHQEKALVVLDAADGWKCVERIPVDIGRKHFRVNSLQEFLDLEPPAVTGTASKVNIGDRVVLAVDQQWMDDYRFSAKIGEENRLETHTQTLRGAGVNVEIREVKEVDLRMVSTSETSNERTLENLSCESIWKAYLEGEIQREAMSLVTADELRRAGLELLEKLEVDREEPAKELGPTEVKFHSVAVEGFGPFRERVTYPLSNRGLVLLRGINRDGGSDSNGSGKTSLAVSTLWALTGTIDSRPLQDNKVADVINESCKTARAVVQGTLNGVEFAITRTKTKSRGSLIFILGGEDLTTQSVKETQALIDEKLGISPQVLSRTLFHGQHALNGLLEASDVKLKEELSLVVPLEKWQEAATRARKEARTANKRTAELDGMISVRSEDLDDSQKRLERAKEALRVREKCFKDALVTYEEEMRRFEEMEDGVGFEGESLEDLRLALSDLEAIVDKQNEDLASLDAKREEGLLPLQRRLLELENEFDKAVSDVQKGTQDLELWTSRMQLAKDKVDSLQSMWKVDLTAGVPADFALPNSCPTCKQPLSQEGAGHDHTDLENSVRNQMMESLAASGEATTMLEKIWKLLRTAETTKANLVEHLTTAREQMHDKTQYWEKRITDLKDSMQNTRQEQERVSTRLAQASVQMERSAKIDSLKASLRSEEERLEFSRETFEQAGGDALDLETKLADLGKEKDEQERVLLVMTTLSQAFSHKGVQTFVLQTAVTSLEAATQAYLTEMSDGAQRLEMTLDSGDGIARRAFVRGKGGEFSERPLGSLSGGQWRRCSLALNFGFADLVARRGNFRSSICILDEPLTHLDQVGRADVGRVVRGMLRRTDDAGLGLSYSTVLIILQDLAAEELEEAFDCIDEVVKRDGASSVLVDGAIV